MRHKKHKTHIHICVRGSPEHSCAHVINFCFCLFQGGYNHQNWRRIQESCEHGVRQNRDCVPLGKRHMAWDGNKEGHWNIGNHKTYQKYV